VEELPDWNHFSSVTLIIGCGMINPICHRQQGNFPAHTGQVLFVAIQMDGNIALGAAVTAVDGVIPVPSFSMNARKRRACGSQFGGGS
jgi:hypothetical protein